APRLPIGAVVLPDSSPLALAEIRPPQVPVAHVPHPHLGQIEAVHPLLLSSHDLSSRRSPSPPRTPRPCGDDPLVDSRALRLHLELLGNSASIKPGDHIAEHNTSLGLVEQLMIKAVVDARVRSGKPA